MITVFFNRKTSECLATEDPKFVKDELFRSGRRNLDDFDIATSSGFIKIQKRGQHLDVTTADNPSVLA